MTRHITWELFSIDYIQPGVPAKFLLKGAPFVEFYVTNKAQRLGLKIHVDENIKLPDILLKELSLELKVDKNKFYADFSTINTALFEHFYSMMCFISDSVQINDNNIIDAINQAVERIKSLVSSENLLSEAKVVGMWGELWVLEKLIKEKGSEAVYFWKGADRAIHDFRVNSNELEVKTTRNEDRVHIISRLSQLEASPDKKLYMCSIQLVEGSTDGFTLGEYVERISQLIGKDSEEQLQFEKQLNKEGYNTQLSAFYPARYYLRSNPSVIPIIEDFPRIIRSTIDEKYGKETSSRISNLHYSVDVTGLGVELTKFEVIKLLSEEK